MAMQLRVLLPQDPTNEIQDLLQELRDRGFHLEIRTIDRTIGHGSNESSDVALDFNADLDHAVRAQDPSFSSVLTSGNREPGFQADILHKIITNIPHFVFWKDRQSFYLGCNENFAKVAGIESPHHIVGKTDYDLAWSRQEADHYRECDRRVMETGVPIIDLEETQLQADGKRAVLLTSKVPLRDSNGEVIGILGLYSDITETRRSQERIRRLFTAVEQASDTIVVTDAKGTIDYVNPAFERITGYRADEAVGRNPRVLKSGRMSESFYRELWETITSGGTWHGVIVNRRKDGSLYEEEASIAPVRDKGGVITNFVAVKRDVTAQRAVEAQLRQAQKLESIGQLAAGIAHEINTPIQFVGDNISFLKEAWPTITHFYQQGVALLTSSLANNDLPPVEIRRRLKEEIDAADLDFVVQEVPKAIAQSLEGIERVTRTVKAMKEVAHPDSGVKSEVDLNHAVENTLLVSRNEWKYVADMVTDFDPSLPPVPCIAGELNQVILNIVVNAAHAIDDATENGKMKRGVITFTTRKDGDWVEIRVADTGTGIPEGIRHRVFDPFFTTKEVGRGTGQGLAIAHSIITKRHGGTISFETREGEGTTFIIRLPLAETAREAARSGTATVPE